MYEAFFNLKHKPFSLLPDPEFLFLSSKHAIALSLLDYSLSGQAGFCVITGEIGSGKTTLIRAFLGRIGREFSVGLISNTHSGLRDIAAWALTAFGQRPSGSNQADTYQELMAYLIAEYGAGRQCILIVDEAQNLSIEALEELRLLSNINTGKDLLLQMVLVGQPELLDKLKRPELSQFAQRIAVSHHLTPLPFGDTRRYIEHRLQVAGSERQIFTEMAMGAVQYFSGGVPRLINSICDMSLVYAFADGEAMITEDLVFRVVADRQRTGIAPFANSASADDPNVRAEITDLARSVGADVAPPTRDTESRDKATEGPVAPSAEPDRQPQEPADLARRPASPEPAPRQVPRAEQPADAFTTRPPEGDPAPVPSHADDTGPVQSEDFYFRSVDIENEEDELVLTVAAVEHTAAPERDASSPPAAQPEESSRMAVPAVDAAANAPNNSQSGDVLRPTWQTPAAAPAAAIESKPWPSVTDRSTRSVTGSARKLAAGTSLSEPASGTAAPPRRSWWRRSLSRGK